MIMMRWICEEVKKILKDVERDTDGMYIIGMREERRE